MQYLLSDKHAGSGDLYAAHISENVKIILRVQVILLPQGHTTVEPLQVWTKHHANVAAVSHMFVYDTPWELIEHQTVSQDI